MPPTSDAPRCFVITKSSDVSIYTPPCECQYCRQSYYLPSQQSHPLFSYRGIVPNIDARRIAARYVLSARHDREYLLQRLTSHADIILKRWKKKSMEKREALLTNTVPELYKYRWLLARHTHTPESWQWQSRDKTRRSQLLLPWLNLEMLKASPTVLFRLLHNRTAYSPQDWAAYDSGQLISSWACGYFDAEYSAKCIVMHGPRYGDLVDWHADSIHRADLMGFPKARLVLEAQAFLMAALRKIVDGTLQGVDIGQPVSSERWRLLVRFGFKQSSGTEIWSPYTNPALFAPPVFNVTNLLSVAQTRLDVASDHLSFLQIDPAYARRHIKVLLQGEIFKFEKPEEAGAAIVREFIWDVLSCLRWRCVRDECEYVKNVHDRFIDNIHPGQPLPLEYDRALGALELLSANLVTTYAKHITDAVVFRPGFRHSWKFNHGPSVNGRSSIKVKRTSTTDMKELFHKDPLEWCILQMDDHPNKQTNFDHAMLFAFLEHHLANNNTKEGARIDDLLYRKLSDVAAFHEIYVSVCLHRPQHKHRKTDEIMRSGERDIWKMMELSNSLSIPEEATLGTMLLEDFYKAPLHSGRRNLAWLQRSQALRTALDMFWKGLKEHLQRAFEKSLGNTEMISNILEVISANRSPEYIRNIQAEQDQVLASIELASGEASVPVQQEWVSGKTTQAIPRPVPAPKSKVKTRIADKQVGNAEKAEDEKINMAHSVEKESSPTIPVKRRAFDVFTLMFPVNAEEASQMVDWDKFVHAMSDVGFAARNGGGSAVIFEEESEGTKGHDGGKIIFHKPHPVAKIDSVMLHSMGKRMTKWFGWSRNSFLLQS